MRLNINLDGIDTGKKQYKKNEIPAANTVKKMSFDGFVKPDDQSPAYLLHKLKNSNTTENLKFEDPRKPLAKKPVNSFLPKSLFRLKSGLIIILIIIFCTSIIGFYKFTQTNSDYQKALTACKNDILSAKDSGVEVVDLKCPEKQLKINDYLSSVSYDNTQQNLQIINSRQDYFNQQIKLLESENLELKKQLNLLEVEDQSKTESEINPRLDLQLQNLKNSNEKLNELLLKSLQKIDDLLEIYLELGSILDPQQEQIVQDYVKNYVTFNQQDKVKNYLDLKLRIYQTQKSITQNPPLKLNSEFAVDLVALSQYKIYSGQDFNTVYEDFVYDRVLEIKDNLNITGNPKVDEYITKKAEKRGYKKRLQANESDLVNYNGYKLQPEMKIALEQMQQEALKSGIKIGLVSGYRSVSDQQNIFLSRFEIASRNEIDRLYTPEEILSGKADKVIDLIQQTSSIPGYSRHHNGYTIDITDTGAGGSFTLFKNTAAYRWISANNFLNAKKFGIIPSYPEGQTLVGPNPEEWEFVWVGVDKLKIQS